MKYLLPLMLLLTACSSSGTPTQPEGTLRLALEEFRNVSVGFFVFNDTDSLATNMVCTFMRDSPSVFLPDEVLFDELESGQDLRLFAEYGRFIENPPTSIEYECEVLLDGVVNRLAGVLSE